MFTAQLVLPTYRKTLMQQIDIKRLDHPSVETYLSTSDRRVLAGARFMLEALGIPLPQYLERKPAGRPFSRVVMTAFRNDHPETMYEATMRKSREHGARIAHTTIPAECRGGFSY